MGAAEELSRAAALLSQRRVSDALEIYQSLLRSDPKLPEAVAGVVVCAFLRGEYAIAVTELRRAIKFAPNNGVFWTQLAESQKAAGDKTLAMRSFEEAIRLLPTDSRLPTNAGSLAFELGRVDEAIALTRRALKVQPNDLVALRNLASMTAKSGDPQDALDAARALASIPPSPPTMTAATQWHLLGNALVMNGQTEEGLSALQHAHAADPADPDIRHSLALAYLAAGRYSEGWAHYPARLELPDYAAKALPPTAKSPWKGEDVTGKTVLVMTEQGAGDAIQFCRYLPALAARGARVVVSCREPLVELLRTVSGVSEVSAGVPEHDLSVPMLDLPLRLGLVGGVPGWDGPYLKAPASRTEVLRRQMESTARGRRIVAVCWTGNPDQPVNRRRSIPAKMLASLKHDWVCLVSAQKVRVPGDDPPRGLFDLDPMPEISDFADTAALLSAVDLVISTDTSVAHLAGALGLPAWVLLHHPAPHWPYGETGDMTPWYPTLRLFRQARYGDWDGVLQSVRDRLLRQDPV